MAHWRTMFDRDYIGAWDLGGRDVVVTIAKVEAGELRSQGKKSAKKPIITFVGAEKKFAANKTNCKIIARLFGNDTSDWVGKKITIFPTTTEFAGEPVECIRVRPSVPSPKAKQDVAKSCNEHGEFYGDVCERCINDEKDISAIDAEAEADTETAGVL